MGLAGSFWSGPQRSKAEVSVKKGTGSRPDSSVAFPESWWCCNKAMASCGTCEAPGAWALPMRWCIEFTELRGSEQRRIVSRPPSGTAAARDSEASPNPFDTAIAAAGLSPSTVLRTWIRHSGTTGLTDNKTFKASRFVLLRWKPRAQPMPAGPAIADAAPPQSAVDSAASLIASALAAVVACCAVVCHAVSPFGMRMPQRVR